MVHTDKAQFLPIASDADHEEIYRIRGYYMPAEVREAITKKVSESISFAPKRRNICGC